MPPILSRTGTLARTGTLTKRLRSRYFAYFCAALLLAPAIVACAQSGGPSAYFDNGGAYPISAESQAEIRRFETVYARYASHTPGRHLKHFSDAFRRVRATYVEEVTDKVLIDAAIEGVEALEGEIGGVDPAVIVEAGLDGMLASLDPHSSYLNAEEFRESRVSTRGQFGGLGIEIMLEDDTIKIVAPIEGTPAEAAGLASGDRITHVDGEDIRGKGLMNAVNLMRGEPGSQVVITILRGDSQSFDVPIVRDIIRVKSVRWRAEDGVGYIRVTRFTERVEPGIVTAMNELREELGADLQGIVLDLRNNPGGLLDQSLILADSFLNDGEIVSIRGRGAGNSRSHSATPGDMASGLPVVVLINSGAASASEIVAGALQENGRATIMGTRSFGKGSVQTITPLPIEGAIRLTTALYYSPDGHAIQGNGVYPDIVLRMPPGDDAVELTREADLPNALDTVEAAWRNNIPVVAADRCPVNGAAVDDEGEAPDLELACAIRFLRTGSVHDFVAQVGVAPQS